MKQKQNRFDLIAKITFGAICVITCATCALFLFTQSDLFPKSSPPAFGWDDIPVDAEAETITAAELIAEEIPEETTIKFVINPDHTSATAPVGLFPKIHVSRIFYDLPRPAAKINGRILRAGDFVSGAQIIEISQENIVIQHESERRSFSLK